MSARLFRISAVISALAAAAACAETAHEETLPPSPDGGSTTLGDGGVDLDDGGAADAGPDDDDASPDDDASGPLCSAAGWCATELPDLGLNVSDIWPFESNAFAFAFSTARGRKIMEWSADAGWRFIDDNTQQTIATGQGGMFAPNRDEVYYTAFDGSVNPQTGLWHGYLFHAKRPATPATAWTWSRTRFDCSVTDTPYVWGLGQDIYAFSCGRIYRLTGDPDTGEIVAANGDSPSWTVEYVDDDPARLQFRGAVGTPDDIWFVGSRGSSLACTTIVRKTATGYERVVDGVGVSLNCNPKPGYPTIPRLQDFYSAKPGELVGTPFRGTITKISMDESGAFTTTTSNPGPTTLGPVWSDSPDEVWLVGNNRAVLHGTDIWSDARSYRYSTLVMAGNPNTNTLAKIRGTSKSNLWAVGLNSAFHKTTP